MKHIDIFPWDDNFDTGLQKVDEQHRRLVGLLNDLASQFAFNADTIDLTTIFNELLEYTQYHFETEEAIWSEYFGGDASEIEHRDSHHRFIQTLQELIRAQQGKAPEEVAEATLDFLVRWLVSHILESDRYMAYRAAALQEGKSREEATASASKLMSGYTRKMIDIILSIYGTLSHNTLRLMRELSERRETEKVLEANEHLMRTVIDEIPDVLVLKDAKGDFLLGNRTVAELYGTTPEEMVGKHDGDFGVPKEMADFFRSNVLSIIERGETEIVYEDSRDATTGEIRHYKSIKKPFKDTEGNDQVLVIAHDMTDEIRAKTELTHQRGFLKTLIRTIPDLIWLKDPEGVYLACNPKFEAVVGATEKEIIGKSDYDFVDKELADAFREQDRKAIETGGLSVDEEWITYASDGHSELLETTKTPMFDANGELIGVLGIGHNITKQRQAEERLKFALSGSSDGLWDWNMETDEVYFSPRWLEMLGYRPGDFPEHLETYKKLLHPEDQERAFTMLEEYLEGRASQFEIELRMRHKNGDWLHILSRARMPKERDGTPKKPLRLVGTHVDVTERWQHQEQLQHIAHYDALTNLPNRLLLADRLHLAIAQTQRQKCLLAVVYLDLDGFKVVNDMHGHETGDELLIAVSKRMKKALREGDTLARLGGDEFVAVLQGLSDTHAAIPVLERLLTAVSAPIAIGEFDLKVSASLGVTFYPQAESVDPDQMIRQADQAMYEAKQAGKNRFHIFDSEHDRTMRSRHESIERIRKALRGGEFVLYYQPKVNMRTGAAIGVEALIRWNHPDDGLLSPAVFLPVIENHTLIVEVGEWVLETAMTQIETWRGKGHHLPVSVNVDGMQLQQTDFVKKLHTMMQRHPALQKGDLELEVLETSALGEIEYVSEIISQCRDIGVGFALDDFGTGYSSLTYLKRLPVQTLKIDQSFVRDMLEDSEDLAIVEGILGLTHVFKRNAVAEGVETEAQGLMLLEMGCELAQGYLIARPMDAECVLEWMQSWKPARSWLESVKK